MQTVLSRIWNQVTESIFYDDNRHTILLYVSVRPYRFHLSYSGDQHRENQEENKLLYPDYELAIQGLLTLSFWNRNHNHSV